MEDRDVLGGGVVIVNKLMFSRGWLAASALVATAVTWRVVNWHYGLAPNLELVTASTLVAATFLTRRAAVGVPLAIMVGSDLIIGNSPILLFTWSAFALIGLAGLVLRRWVKQPSKLLVMSLGAGLGGSVFFFLYTNFGVWLLGDGTMYAKTWAGLVQCYVMGLPFYRTMLLGNMVLVPAYFAAAVYGPGLARSMAARWRLAWEH
jgi:hypothetical protein